MTRSILAGCAGALAVLFGLQANAQTISEEDFSRHAEISEVTLSPRGNYVALAVPREHGTETELQIVKLDGSGQTQTLRFGKRNHVTGVTWTADEQVTVARAKMEPLIEQPQSLGELMSSDIHGANQEILFANIPDRGNIRGRRKDEGFASLVKVLDNEPGMALVSYTCWYCREEPDSVIFKVDTVTGERREVERVGEPAWFVFDHDGIARVMVAMDDNDVPELSYRPQPDSGWRPLSESLVGYTLVSGRFDRDNNILYALISDSGEAAQLYRLDLAAGTRQKLLGRDDVDISYLLYAGRNSIPFGAVYDAGGPSIEYLDPASEWAQLHLALMKLFPGEMIDFIDYSRDNRTLLLVVGSDRHPGAYYVFDRDSQKMQLVAEAMPWIEPAKMASMKPVKFSARDGSNLYGFYTSKGQGPQPLVVMPHGGPHGPYDRWDYNSDVQFLANRGYAVLQVNFRGSGGRGHNFEEAGWREWGGLIQDDIADGVGWAIEQQLADPQRICIYGASFGGYAALMNPIRYPDLYQCAIGYVGVYDLALMYDAGDINDTRFGRRYLSRVLGNDQATLAANSPARRVDEIKVPVLLAQGTIDRRVPMDQFHALTDAFARSGRPAQTLVISGEGHGFYDPENQARMYRTMETFLDKHIGAGAQ